MLFRLFVSVEHFLTKITIWWVELHEANAVLNKLGKFQGLYRLVNDALLSSHWFKNFYSRRGWITSTRSWPELRERGLGVNQLSGLVSFMELDSLDGNLTDIQVQHPDSDGGRLYLAPPVPVSQWSERHWWWWASCYLCGVRRSKWWNK